MKNIRRYGGSENSCFGSLSACYFPMGSAPHQSERTLLRVRVIQILFVFSIV